MNEVNEPLSLEVSILVKTEDLRLPSGEYVRRKTMSNGTIADTMIFPDDAVNPRTVKA